MIGGRRVVAIIPARGGTDTVPYLNIKRLGDCPLVAHTIQAACGAATVDRVVVSTDDAAVAEVARRYGADVPFLRPVDLAADLPSLKPVIAHAVRELEAAGDHPDVVVVLQPTTPFRGAASIDEAVGQLVQGGYDAVLSMTEDRTLNWRAEGGRLVPLFLHAGRREEQEPVYKENGAVVALRRGVLDLAERFGPAVGFIVLDKREGFTVYDLEDFWMAERLLRQPRVLFRVDGGADMGMGHVYRSLAIADALRGLSRAEVAFLMGAERPEGMRAVAGRGYPVRVAGDGALDTFVEHVRDFAPEILINDLPVLESAYLRALSHLGCTTVNLVDTPDDLETTEHYEQVIVSVMTQERETPENFYAGPAYAILREQFRGREKVPREVARTVLLSFGGSDPQGLTLKAARALAPVDRQVELIAVAGPAFSWRRELDALAAELGGRVRVIHDAAGHISELMLEADLMVGSGGMSVYEIAALGTPGVILGQNLREDRRMRAFAVHGTVEYLGLGTDVGEDALRAAVEALLGDAGRRRAMGEKGRALVDGLGATRTAEVLLERRKKPRPPGGRRAEEVRG